MKSILTFVLAAVAAAPVFANVVPTTPAPDGGATALLAALSFGGLVLARNAMKKR